MKDINAAKLILPVAVILTAIIAVVWFGIIGQSQTLSASNAVLAKKEAELEELSEKVNKLQAASREEDQINEAYDRALSLWPDKEEVSKFIVQTEGLAADKDIVLSNITIAEKLIKATTNDNSNEDLDETVSKKKNKNEPGIRFSFDATAPYPKVLAFISGLENLARLNTINGLNLTANNEKDIVTKISGYIYAK